MSDSTAITLAIREQNDLEKRRALAEYVELTEILEDLGAFYRSLNPPEPYSPEDVRIPGVAHMWEHPRRAPEPYSPEDVRIRELFIKLRARIFGLRMAYGSIVVDPSSWRVA